MLDLSRLQRLRLRTHPLSHEVLARLVTFNYLLPPWRTEVVIEGLENIPSDRGVFLAMNHTDRFNYAPFQSHLVVYHPQTRRTAAWVKGKYYENAIVAYLLDATNNIPLPSRGYVISTEFRALQGRQPTDAEYRALRDLDARGAVPPAGAAGEPLDPALAQLLASALGCTAEQAAAGFAARCRSSFAMLMGETLRLTQLALDERQLHVIVFPEGTRQARVGRGHTGMAQVAQRLGTTIVPVGCSGSDRIYPGNVPWSRGGRVVYRIGAPIAVDDPAIARFRVPSDVMPLTDEATQRFGAHYQAITDVVMARINDLVDDDYRASDDASRAQGVGRFL